VPRRRVARTIVLSGVGAHQLEIAAVFALACVFLLSYRLIKPHSRPGAILAFSLLCALVSLCFGSTAYLDGDSTRAQVIGSALVGLAVCTGWSVLSLKQAEHLWAAEVTYSERAMLRACPYILATALASNLFLGLLFPVPVLEFYAGAPLHYLPYKLVLLVPEAFCVAFSAYVFFKAAGPSVQVGRIRLQNFSFFLGSAFLAVVPLQAIANACVRVFADRQTRHFWVPVLLNSELVLTVLFVGCFIAGVALYYSKDEKDKTMERFARWRRHRESFDRALWSLTGSAYEGHAAILARVAVAAGELRRRSEEEERDGLPHAFTADDHRKASDTVRLLILLDSKERLPDHVSPRGLVFSLIRFHNHLLKNPRTANMSWRIIDDETHPSHLYSLRSDPIHEPLSKVSKLVFDVHSSPNLLAEPQWLQLAAVAAADASLLGLEWEHRNLKRPVVKARISRAYENAKLAAQIHRFSERSGIQSHTTG
jgi:hypothetical protein